MTREMMNSVKRNKQEAAEMVRFANPRSKTRPTMERVIEILVRHIPYMYSEGKPEIVNVEIARYNANSLIKCADFIVTLANGKVWRIDVHQNLKGRTPEEREADKTATFPSGLFHFFHEEITETLKGDGEPVPTETESKPETKAIEFFQTTKGHIAKVNGVIVWFIRNERENLKYKNPYDKWFVYQSADGGDTFKLIPAECVEDADGNVDWEQPHKFHWDTLQAAKSFIYNQELKGVA